MPKNLCNHEFSVVCCRPAMSLVLPLASSVNSPPGHRFDHHNLHMYVHICPDTCTSNITSIWPVILNASHFSLLDIIVSPDTGAKQTGITRSLWQKFSNLWTFLSLPHLWLYNLFKSLWDSCGPGSIWDLLYCSFHLNLFLFAKWAHVHTDLFRFNDGVQVLLLFFRDECILTSKKERK